MKLYTEVIPNPFNDSGYVIIIYKQILFLSFELGRVLDEVGLQKFLEAYHKHQGKTL